MAIKRVVDTEFWTDEKVVDMFSPEDKLFMLYLLTNPHTRQLGIYKLVKRQAAFELGYSTDTVSVLLERFENKYDIIKYSIKTSEVAIKNFLVHSIVKGGKPVEDCLLKDINEVKDKSLLSYIFNNLYNKDNLNETVKKIIDNYNENNNDNDSIVDESYNESCDTINSNTETIKNVINYLNSKLNSKYSDKAQQNTKYINARINEGHTFEDFKTVIDKKHAEWKGTEWEKYLRPETLFGSKFEGYLNQTNYNKRIVNDYTEEERRSYRREGDEYN